MYKRYSNIIGGLKAKNNGANFENIIDKACRNYAIKQIAYIEKSPEPMRVIRPMQDGKFIACYTKSAQPDYKGTLKGGRAVCFEAKHTSKNSIEQSRITPAQWQALDTHQNLGALCFVLVSFNFEKFYRVPWALWANMQERFNRKSIKPADIAEYQIDILDFLKGAL